MSGSDNPVDLARVAAIVMETSQAIAEGYRKSISGHPNEEAACAASNTGYFILKALGFSHDEIKSISSVREPA